LGAYLFDDHFPQHPLNPITFGHQGIRRPWKGVTGNPVGWWKDPETKRQVVFFGVGRGSTFFGGDEISVEVLNC